MLRQSNTNKWPNSAIKSLAFLCESLSQSSKPDKPNFENSFSNFSSFSYALLESTPFPWLPSLVLIFGASMGGTILVILTNPMVVFYGTVMGLADKFLT